MEALDSISEERLAAALDERAATKVLFAKRTYTTCGAVESACDIVSKRFAWQPALHGPQRNPGGAMPDKP